MTKLSLCPAHSPWKISAHCMVLTTCLMPPNLSLGSACHLSSIQHVHWPISTSNLLSSKKNLKISPTAQKKKKKSSKFLMLGITKNFSPLPYPLTPTFCPFSLVQWISSVPTFLHAFFQIQSLCSSYSLCHQHHPSSKIQNKPSPPNNPSSIPHYRKTVHTVQLSLYYKPPCIIYWSDFFTRWKISKRKTMCPLHLPTFTLQHGASQQVMPLPLWLGQSIMQECPRH